MKNKIIARPWLALFTLICFAFMMPITNVPLPAAASGHTDARADQSPGAIERAATSKMLVQRKPLPILPILAGVVAVGVVALLVLVVFKVNYDIVGSWKWTSVDSHQELNLFISFLGTEASGPLVTLGDVSASGTYRVDGKNVTLQILPTWGNINFSGEFDGRKTIIGTESGYCSVCGTSFSGTATLIQVADVTVPEKLGPPLSHRHLGE